MSVVVLLGPLAVWRRRLTTMTNLNLLPTRARSRRIPSRRALKLYTFHVHSLKSASCSFSVINRKNTCGRRVVAQHLSGVASFDRLRTRGAFPHSTLLILPSINSPRPVEGQGAAHDLGLAKGRDCKVRTSARPEREAS